ncbi:g10870 [Coccomyxa elongata]
MRSSYYVTLIACLLANASAKKAWKDVDTLQIGVKHKPEECPRKSQLGNEIQIHYTGWLTDGTQFGSSIGEEPFKFQMGEGDVIEGWEQGLLNMCVGEMRRLKIPAALGYRDKGFADLGIPAGASLYFDTELVSIEDGPVVIHLDANSLNDLSEF